MVSTYLSFQHYNLILFHEIEPAIPPNAVSQNIAQILGTNTSAFELLVLKRRIMGPCWITIKNPVIDNKGVSSRFILTA